MDSSTASKSTPGTSPTIDVPPSLPHTTGTPPSDVLDSPSTPIKLIGFINLRQLLLVNESLTESLSTEDANMAEWIQQHYLAEIQPHEVGRPIYSDEDFFNLQQACARVKKLTNNTRPEDPPFYGLDGRRLPQSILKENLLSHGKKQPATEEIDMVKESESKEVAKDPIKPNIVAQTSDTATIAIEVPISDPLSFQQQSLRSQNYPGLHIDGGEAADTAAELSMGTMTAVLSDPITTNLDKRPSYMSTLKRKSSEPSDSPSKRTKRNTGVVRRGRGSRRRGGRGAHTHGSQATTELQEEPGASALNPAAVETQQPKKVTRSSSRLAVKQVSLSPNTSKLTGNAIDNVKSNQDQTVAEVHKETASPVRKVTLKLQTTPTTTTIPKPIETLAPTEEEELLRSALRRTNAVNLAAASMMSGTKKVAADKGTNKPASTTSTTATIEFIALVNNGGKITEVKLEDRHLFANPDLIRRYADYKAMEGPDMNLTFSQFEYMRTFFKD